MARFDAENVLKNALNLVKTKLNEEIQAINTEKGDFSISEVNQAAFYFAQLPKAYNFNPMVIYGFDPQAPQIEGAQEDNFIKPINLYFEVVLVDGGMKEDQNIIYQLMRYSRALEDLFTKNFSKIMEGYGKIQVSSLSPTTLFSLDGKTIRSAGVSLTARITAR